MRRPIIGAFGIGATLADPLRHRSNARRGPKTLLFHRTSA
jgi:hypothetical protein